MWNVQVLFYFFVLNEICLHENRDKMYAFLIKFLVYVVAIHRSTKKNSNLSFHATFLKQFIVKHITCIMFQCYYGSFMKYMLNAYITVCACINILVVCNATWLYISVICLINLIFFHYINTVCTLYDRTFMIHATNISGIKLFFIYNLVATKHICIKIILVKECIV